MPSLPLRPAAEKRVCRIEISRIEPNPRQPRSAMDENQLRSLADSIRQHGLITPLLVRRTVSGDFQLIAGERRLRALKLLGSSHAEALILPANALDSALLALIENMQREDLHFLDEAEACRRILQEHNLTQEELASGIGCSPSALANRLRLLRLSRNVRACVREGGLGERHARALLRLEDETLRIDFARRAAREHLSVRELEKQIDQQLKTQKKQPRTIGCGAFGHKLLI